MKKIAYAAICLIMMFVLCSCGGNVKNAKTHEVESEIYTADEIDSAIDVIKREFVKEWSGCTLKEIYYAGDGALENYRERADGNDADEVIVLLSSFDVDRTGGDGSLNPNSTYSGWNWILTRKAGGKWKHIDHGY